MVRILRIIIGMALSGIFAASAMAQETQTCAALNEAITGGSNFGFFSALAHGSKPKGLQLQINGTGAVPQVSYFITPASARQNPNDPAYWSLDKAKPPITIMNGSFWTAKTLKPGKYIIQFSTPYRSWVEELEIAKKDGRYQQSITVTGDDKLLYSTNGLVDESAFPLVTASH